MRYFVTGGSRGLGAGLVKTAVREGHDVAFTWIHNEAAAQAVAAEARALRPGAKIHVARLDVADARAVEAVSDGVLEAMDGVDVVVNCAGLNRDNLVVSMSDDEWSDVIAANLSGPFYVCRAFLQSMLASRFGRIVNISSIQHSGGSGQANYAASKAGLIGLTKTLAKEYGRRGITANVVVPGFFDTDMTRGTMPDVSKEYWRKYCPVPKGRMGTAEEFAQLVLFLGSPAAAFINGQVIPITGGLDWTT